MASAAQSNSSDSYENFTDLMEMIGYLDLRMTQSFKEAIIASDAIVNCNLMSHNILAIRNLCNTCIQVLDSKNVDSIFMLALSFTSAMATQRRSARSLLKSVRVFGVLNDNNSALYNQLGSLLIPMLVNATSDKGFGSKLRDLISHHLNDIKKKDKVRVEHCIIRFITGALASERLVWDSLSSFPNKLRSKEDITAWYIRSGKLLNIEDSINRCVIFRPIRHRELSATISNYKQGFQVADGCFAFRIIDSPNVPTVSDDLYIRLCSLVYTIMCYKIVLDPDVLAVFERTIMRNSVLTERGGFDCIDSVIEGLCSNNKETMNTILSMLEMIANVNEPVAIYQIYHDAVNYPVYGAWKTSLIEETLLSTGALLTGPNVHDWPSAEINFTQTDLEDIAGLLRD